jgi:hypothetical protein
MKNYVIGILSFLGGAAIGGVVTWKVLEKRTEEKYKIISDEEIRSVKEVFTVPKKDTSSTENKEDIKEAVNKPSLTAVAKEIAKQYTNYSNVAEPERREPLPWEEPRIRVIEPDKYGEKEEYDQIELTLYADGILADERDDIVEKEVVGDALDHMGEYEDDVIHVQDDEKKRYFEIMVDNRSYEDATGNKPPEDSKEE